jgi:hypothetical protein
MKFWTIIGLFSFLLEFQPKIKKWIYHHSTGVLYYTSVLSNSAVLLGLSNAPRNLFPNHVHAYANYLRRQIINVKMLIFQIYFLCSNNKLFWIKRIWNTINYYNCLVTPCKCVNSTCTTLVKQIIVIDIPQM